MKQLLLAALLAVLMCPALQAQTSRLLEEKMQLPMPGIGGSNGASVAFHVGNKHYYSAMAGNSTYPLAIFNEQGKMLAGDIGESMIDVRGLWFHTKRGKLMGNAFDDGGWFEYVLDKNKRPAEVKVVVAGQTQPNKQSVGAFDAKSNEVVFFDGTDIVFYSAEGEVKATWNMEELLTLWGELEYLPEDYNQTIVYTGKPGMEYALLNVAANRIELFGRNKKRTGFLIVPVSQPLYEFFNFAYTNGHYWLFDKEQRSWTGYREGGTAPKQAAPAKVASAPAASKPAASSANGPTAGFVMPALSRATPARIINPSDVFTTYNLGAASSKLDGWRSRYSQAFVAELLKRSNEKGWPAGIADFDSRDQNRELFKQLKTFHFDDVDADKVILWVPAADNKSMPISMQGGFDYFLVVRKAGISYGAAAAPAASSQSSGAASSWGDLGTQMLANNAGKGSAAAAMFTTSGKRTIIDDPADMYSTYDMKNQPALLQQWTNRYGAAKANEVVRLMHENAWPQGVNSLAKRDAVRQGFKNIVAYYLDDIDDSKVLLYVPAADNKHMQADWKELKDFFIVMAKKAVRLGDKLATSMTVVPAPAGTAAAPRRTIIHDAGKLYTTTQMEGTPLHTRLKAAYGEEQAGWIVRRVHEKNYPAGINSLDGWRNHRTDFNLYNCYYIDDVDNERILLWIPAAENKHMPADMQDGSDLYLVIGRIGVTMGDRTSLLGKKLNNKVYGTNLEIVLPKQ